MNSKPAITAEVRVNGVSEVVIPNWADYEVQRDIFSRYDGVEGAEILPIGRKTLGRRRTHARRFAFHDGRWCQG